MHKTANIFIILIIFLIVFFIGLESVFAGKLYIKPELEIKRAKRLLDAAESDFRYGKIHFAYSPEVAITEFESSKRKFQQAISIIEKYGEGKFTPGDVDDFVARIKECDLWIAKCKQALKK